MFFLCNIIVKSSVLLVKDVVLISANCAFIAFTMIVEKSPHYLARLLWKQRKLIALNPK